MYKEHPERMPDEVYLGMFDDTFDCGDQTMRTSWECVGWSTKRRGTELPDRTFPVFVKQNEIRKAEDGEKILANLLPGSYSEFDIPNVIRRMVTLISSPFDRDSVSEFIEQHPWTMKYVSGGFSEANQLREMGQKPGFQIILHVPTEREATLRQRHGKPQISYETVDPQHRFQFRFEEKSPGSYRAISG